jgi:hypothetical protein
VPEQPLVIPQEPTAQPSSGVLANYEYPSKSTCKDSDHGRDYFTQGTVKGGYEKKWGYEYQDTCTTPTTLQEWFCQDSKPRSQLRQCDCNDGACAKEEAPEEQDADQNEDVFTTEKISGCFDSDVSFDTPEEIPGYARAHPQGERKGKAIRYEDHCTVQNHAATTREWFCLRAEVTYEDIPCVMNECNAEGTACRSSTGCGNRKVEPELGEECDIGSGEWPPGVCTGEEATGRVVIGHCINCKCKYSAYFKKTGTITEPPSYPLGTPESERFFGPAQPQTFTGPTCMDGDNTNYRAKGFVEGFNSDGTKYHYDDTCMVIEYLKEYLCKGTGPVVHMERCTCIDGAYV